MNTNTLAAPSLSVKREAQRFFPDETLLEFARHGYIVAENEAGTAIFHRATENSGLSLVFQDKPEGGRVCQLQLEIEGTQARRSTLEELENYTPAHYSALLDGLDKMVDQELDAAGLDPETAEPVAPVVALSRNSVSDEERDEVAQAALRDVPDSVDVQLSAQDVERPENALGRTGFVKYREESENVDVYTRYLASHHKQNVVVFGDTAVLSLLDETNKTLDNQKLFNKNLTEIGAAADKMLVTHSVPRDVIRPPEAPEPDTLDSFLREHLKKGNFQRVSLPEGEQPKDYDVYRRDLEGEKGKRFAQYLRVPRENSELPVLVETVDSMGRIQKTKSGEKLSAEVNLARANSESDDEFVGRKAAEGVKALDGQLAALNSKEPTKLTQVRETEFEREGDEAYRRLLQTQSMLEQLKEGALKFGSYLEKNNSWAGAFMKGWRAADNHIEAVKAVGTTLSELGSRVVGTPYAEVGAVNREVQSLYKGLTVQTPKQGLQEGSVLSQNKMARIEGEVLGESKHGVVVRLHEPRNRAIYFPARTLERNNNDLSAGAQVSISWDFGTQRGAVEKSRQKQASRGGREA